MTLLAMAATSALRNFDPKANKPVPPGDKKAFYDCVGAFFPWRDVGIGDGAHSSQSDRIKAATETLYTSLRNPLVHSGGAVGTGWPRIIIVHPFPGLASFADNESKIAELCGLDTLDGQTFIELDAFQTKVHTRPLYWGARKMIEAFAADGAVQGDIVRNQGF